VLVAWCSFGTIGWKNGIGAAAIEDLVLPIHGSSAWRVMSSFGPTANFWPTHLSEFLRIILLLLVEA
jgi:hypothetical protein